MTERFLTVDGIQLSKSKKKTGMIKTYSFTTDDDDAITVVDSKESSNNDRSLSIDPPSEVETANEHPLSEPNTTLVRRKPRRRAEPEVTSGRKSSSTTKYDKMDWSKLLIFVSVLIFIYFMWLKKDIWIPRLLSSNIRIRRSVNFKKSESNNEILESSPDILTTSTTGLLRDSTSKSSQKEEKIEEKTDQQSESEGSTDESTSTSTKSKNTPKININIRRTKVKFNQDNQKTKRTPSKDRLVDDKSETKPNKIEEPILPTKNHSLIKQQDRSLIPTKKLKNSTSSFNSNITLVTYDDIVNQLRVNLKSRSRNRKNLTKILKTSGLTKNQLYRFIYKKDYKILTLSTFISLLDTFNLMILVSPK